MSFEKFKLAELIVEVLQNLPGIIGLVYGVWLMVEGRATGAKSTRTALRALGAFILGAFGSAVVIEVAERLKDYTHAPSVIGFFTNVAIFMSMAVLLAGAMYAFMRWFPNNWGILCGIFLALMSFAGGAMQGFGTPDGMPSPVHGFAIACGIAFAFGPLQKVLATGNKRLVWGFALVMTLMFSVPIYIIDYVLPLT